MYIALRLLVPGKAEVIQNPTHGGPSAPEGILELTFLFMAALFFALKVYRTVRPAVVLLAICLSSL